MDELDPPLNVEEDGKVEILLSIEFDEDMRVRVSPEVAHRLLTGNFDGEDVDDLPGVDIASEISTMRISIVNAYEARPLPTKKKEKEEDTE